MKKTAVALSILVTLIVATLSWAGPFGIDMGMQLKDFRGVASPIGERVYHIKRVPKPHPSFSIYAACITPKEGVHIVRGITSNIKTNVYGYGLTNEFTIIMRSLEAKYGKCLVLDYLNTDSIWNDPKDFTMAIQNEERVLAAVWDKEEGSTLNDNIESILLKVKCNNPNSGIIFIEYTFVNNDRAIAEGTLLSSEGL